MALAVVALFVALLPGPAAKLCIAPGGHVSIEEMDSECCEPGDISDTATHGFANRLEGAGDCGNCTDIPIVSFGPETIKTTQRATGAPAFEPPKMLPAADFSALLPEEDPAAYNALGPAFSSIPLLC